MIFPCRIVADVVALRNDAFAREREGVSGRVSSNRTFLPEGEIFMPVISHLWIIRDYYLQPKSVAGPSNAK